jgi:GDP-L-fucose synthase
MKKNSKIYIAGHNGMVGSAIFRLLEQKAYKNIITMDKEMLDLTNENQVKKFFNNTMPDYVFLAAAKVGGIEANRRDPVAFLLSNLRIQNNIIENSARINVKKLIFLGSSCIYPKECLQPMKEEYLMTDPLEPTNEGYAIAKIAGLKLAQYYHKQYGLSVLNAMPSNVYGTNDHFDSVNSHVLSALIKKFVDAKDNKINEVVVWGSGIAKREFLHVDDLAKSLLFLIENYNSSDIINIGTGKDISIRELAEKIAKIVGFTGNIVWDTTKPDGMLRKCLDISKLNSLGFEADVDLTSGITQTIDEYKIFKNKKRL